MEYYLISLAIAAGLGADPLQTLQRKRILLWPLVVLRMDAVYRGNYPCAVYP